MSRAPRRSPAGIERRARLAGLLLFLVCLEQRPLRAAEPDASAEPPPAGEVAEPEPAPASPPAAADPAPGGADEQVARSVALYKAERYTEAAAAMESAYRLRARPIYLFNAAQAYRRADRPKEALVYYRRFLDIAPEAPQASETAGYIKNMELLQAERDRAAREAAGRQRAQASVTQSQADLELTRRRAGLAEQAHRRGRRRAGLIGGLTGAVVVIGLSIALPLILTREPGTDWGFHMVTF